MPTPYDPTDYDPRSLEALQPLRRYHAWIRASFGDRLRGRVLEVGAGTGTFAETWIDEADEAWLLEPAGQPRATLTRRFGGRPRVHVLPGTLADARGPIAAHTLDTVVMVNVLEHLPDDVEALTLAQGLLGPAGGLCLFVPALPALYGSLDALVGHQRRYTPATLRKAVTAAGFTVETLRWFDLAGVVPWWVVGRVIRARSFDGPLGALYDRWVVPWARAMESRFAPPLGKNLLCIARPNAPGAP